LGTVLGLIGSFIGLLRLLAYGLEIPLLKIYFTHPELQLYGFVTIFIMGVSLGLLPRFRNKPSPPPALSLATVSLVFVAGILKFIDYSSPASDAILLTCSIVYAAIIASILGRPRGFFWAADSFIILSPILLSASLVAKLFLNDPWRDARFVELALLGFPTAIIIGVSMRTIRFRVGAEYYGGPAKACLATYLAALAFLPFQEHLLSLVRRVFFLVTGGLFMATIDMAKSLKTHAREATLSPRDRARHRYFRLYFTTALLWLAAALIFNMLQSGSPGFRFRDSFIHSIAVGFIANMIMAYSPILLPTLMSGRVVTTGLSTAPWLLVNAGNLWRVMASSLSSLTAAYPSGLLVLAGLLYFLVMIHRLR